MRAAKEHKDKSLLPVLCLLLVVLAPSWLGAQTNAAKAGPPPNRYLLVVETSRAMQKRLDGAVQAVGALLGSRMGGQLRPGDSIGVWTFDQALHTGEFPLQHWYPQSQDAILERVVAFLNSQKYNQAAKIESFVPALNGILKESEYITVFLVTTGIEPLHGLPVDEAANQTFKQWREQQQKAHMPYIAFLRASKGTLTDFSINPAQWAVEMPPLPPELTVVAEAEKAPPPKPATNLPGPSLIVHGKKPEPAKPTAPPIPDLPSVSPVPSPEAAVPASNLLATVALRPATTKANPNAALIAAPEAAGANSGLKPAPRPASGPLQSPPAATKTAPPLATGSSNQPPTAPALTAPTAAPVASSAPTAALHSHWRLWLGGGCIAGVTVVLLLRRYRRPRSVAQGSLITRSLERKPPR